MTGDTLEVRDLRTEEFIAVSTSSLGSKELIGLKGFAKGFFDDTKYFFR